MRSWGQRRPWALPPSRQRPTPPPPQPSTARQCLPLHLQTESIKTLLRFNFISHRAEKEDGVHLVRLVGRNHHRTFRSGDTSVCQVHLKVFTIAIFQYLIFLLWQDPTWKAVLAGVMDKGNENVTGIPSSHSNLVFNGLYIFWLHLGSIVSSLVCVGYHICFGFILAGLFPILPALPGERSETANVESQGRNHICHLLGSNNNFKMDQNPDNLWRGPEMQFSKHITSVPPAGPSITVQFLLETDIYFKTITNNKWF